MNDKTAEYDYEASSYDESRFCIEQGQHLDYMHKKIVKNLLHSSKGLMLDVGTGTGRFSIWFAEKGFEVIGLDVSKEMLKKAKRKAFLQHVNVNFILADAGYFPFRRAVLDTCISINVIDHVYNIKNFLKEARYILKAKGFLIFNFSNMISLYLPFAIFINWKNQAMFKKNKIYSHWHTLKAIDALLLISKFELKDFRGCMIASPLPLGEKFMNIIKIINLSIENSKIKFISGSIFIKAQPARSKFRVL
jgi:ubiquinone/menaquinone biosynthesis C-methylase UbiE